MTKITLDMLTTLEDGTVFCNSPWMIAEALVEERATGAVLDLWSATADALKSIQQLLERVEDHQAEEILESFTKRCNDIEARLLRCQSVAVSYIKANAVVIENGEPGSHIDK